MESALRLHPLVAEMTSKAVREGLVVAEHDNAGIRPATLNTVTAAVQLGGQVHVLVAGAGAQSAASAAAQIAGVAKVLHADGELFAHASGASSLS